MQFPGRVTFDDKLCRLQINNLRKTRPLVESECKFHVGHIYREIEYELNQIGLKIITEEAADQDLDANNAFSGSSPSNFVRDLFMQTDAITGTPGLINTLIHECIKHNCSSRFLRDVIDQYDSNGEVSGVRLLVALNRLRRGIWEFNILERVECIEENYLYWSFRKCIFEMECIHEVKPTLYNRTTTVTKLLYKANHHPRLDQFASNSMLIFDMLHDEFLERSSPSDSAGFSFDLVDSRTLLDCIKSLGIDIDAENYGLVMEDAKKRKLH
jgi:hypothetical protein